jgi:hypothetical protein
MVRVRIRVSNRRIVASGLIVGKTKRETRLGGWVGVLLRRKKVRIVEENPYRLPLHLLPFGAGQTSIQNPAMVHTHNPEQNNSA